MRDDESEVWRTGSEDLLGSEGLMDAGILFDVEDA